MLCDENKVKARNSFEAILSGERLSGQVIHRKTQRLEDIAEEKKKKQDNINGKSHFSGKL